MTLEAYLVFASDIRLSHVVQAINGRIAAFNIKIDGIDHKLIANVNRLDTPGSF